MHTHRCMLRALSLSFLHFAPLPTHPLPLLSNIPPPPSLPPLFLFCLIPPPLSCA